MKLDFSWQVRDQNIHRKNSSGALLKGAGQLTLLKFLSTKEAPKNAGSPNFVEPKKCKVRLSSQTK
jgi:hypothetical protein